MNTLHPHWQSDEGQPVRITAKQTPAQQTPTEAPMRFKAVSRRPAAIVGITLTLLALFGIFRPESGSHTVGQAQNEYKIVLTPDGPIPDSISVLPGDQVIFLNLLEDPQRINIEEIPNYNGITETDPIDFQNTFTITVNDDAEGGEYGYYGLDADVIQGMVIVESASGEESAEEEPFDDGSFDESDTFDSFIEEGSSDEEDILYDNGEPTFDELYPYPDSVFETEGTENTFALPDMDPLPTDETTTTTYPAQALPQNPFTVQYGQYRGAPTPPPYQGFTELEQHAGAPLNTLPSRPISQPATGAGEWLVVFLSTGAVLCMTRKAFRKI